MLIPRVIPVLLILDDTFVKTVRYRDPVYVGDPVNVIDLFNRFEVDEIALLDIRATNEDRDPSYGLIEALAAECWVPLTYGGGIRTFEQARQILSIGVEKVVFGSALMNAPEAVTEVAATYGRQAVVASVDALRRGDRWEAMIDNAQRSTGLEPVELAQRAVSLGAGEILLNAVDRDGTMEGFDLDLIRSVTSAIRVPVVACGGAGSRDHLAGPIRLAGASAVAAGSLFVFQGQSRGVLVNFPPRAQLERLLR